MAAMAMPVEKQETLCVCNHNIVLIGFMGSGKTTMGRYLAAATGFACYDADAVIEEQEGRSIPEIFASNGEPYFRALERRVIGRLSQTEQAVIACGGGAVLDCANVAALKQTGKLVWLQAQPETIWERLKNDQGRPLLASHKATAIRELMGTRQPLYSAAADFAIPTDDKTVPQIGGEILELLTARL